MKKRIVNISLPAIASLFVCLAGFAQQNKPTGDKQVPGPAVAATNIHTGGAYTGTTVNYVRSWQPNKPLQSETDVVNETDVSKVGHTTQYFDGLGRPLQTVGWQTAPGKTDMVAPVEYDEFGREVYKYLPYVSADNTGGFKNDPFTQQSTFYTTAYPADQAAITGEQVFYGKTNYEASPLSRIEKTFAPGNSWAGSEGSTGEHGVSMQYLINTADDDVKIWNIDSYDFTYPNSNEHQSENIPATSLPYDAGQLYKMVTTDEAGNAVAEYKDKDGHIVLKKVQAGSVTPTDAYTNWLCTYYVYDDLGQLRFVIPPKAVKEMAKTSNWTLSADMINEICFRYEYDARQRMIAKKVPGAAWVYLIYDRRDRLVMTQDGNLRKSRQWLYTLYDALNRPVQTGMVTDNTNLDPVAMQTAVDAVISSGSSGAVLTTGDFTGGSTAIPADKTVTQWDAQHPDQQATNTITFDDGYASTDGYAGDQFAAEIVSGGTTTGNSSFSNSTGVVDNPIPAADKSSMVALTLTYYDSYKDEAGTSLSAKTYDNSAGSKMTTAIGTPANVYPEATPSAASAMTTGLATCTRVRVLQNPNNLSTGKWLETVSFYDDKGRTVQVAGDNYAGGSDVASSLYDFTGKTISSYTKHTQAANDPTPVTALTWMTFDENGRVVETHKRINDDISSDRTLSVNHYDRMGQLLTKELGKKRSMETGGLTTDALETQSYQYNIRGWLKGINWNYAGNVPSDKNETTSQQDISAGKWFSMDLSYDWGYGTNQYNGNIAGMRWQSAGDREERSYGYGYDMANRLLFGDFKQQFGSTAASWANNDPANANYKTDFSVKMGDGIGNGVSTSADDEPYDANGNIMHMQQAGMFFTSASATSDWIDKLSYAYTKSSAGTMTNKLSSVIEDPSVTDHKLGDFSDHGNITDDDYEYDVNGNLTKDRNKHILSITYNHLNLPYQITVENDDHSQKGTITYLYDAAGNKMQKITDEKASATLNSNTQKVTTTTYNGALQYEQVTITVGSTSPSAGTNALQFIGTEEGRLRVLLAAPLTTDATSQYAYDYFIKDHLGNVRMTLTDEYKKDYYPAATLENNAAALLNEQAVYDIKNNDPNIRSTSEIPGYTTTCTNCSYPNKNGGTNPLDPPVNNNPAANVTAPSQRMYRLNGTDQNARIGLGVTLKVMAGDKVDIWGKSYWQNTGTTANNNNPVSSVLESLLGSLLGSPAVAGSSHGALSAQGLGSAASPTSAPLTDIVNGNNPPANTQTPKAGINWILFDEQFRPVNKGSVYESNYSAVSTTGNEVTTHTMTASVAESGYLYVYCSNESNKDVFFDNLQVIDRRGPLTEENSYYPFGLTMAGISSKALNFGDPENKLKYNGIELDEDLDLDVYEAYYRNLDPQTGRWWQIDPKLENQESLSPYNAMANDPIRNSDPLGDEPNDGGGLWHKIVKNVSITADQLGLKTIYRDAVSVARAINTTINPLTPAVELVTGKSVASNLTQDKSRAVSAGETLMVLMPVAKAEGTLAKITEVAMTSSTEKAAVNNVISEVQISAKDLAQSHAAEVLQAGGKLPTMAGAAVDRVTGATATDISGLPHAELVSPLKEQAPGQTLTGWSPCNCAETKAVNKLVNGGSNINNIDYHAVRVKTGASEQPCANCKLTLRGANHLQ